MADTPLTLGWLGLCLGPFYLLLPCLPWKQECGGVSLLGFSVIHHHKWDISMVFVQSQKLFRVWDCVGLSDSSSPVFPAACLVFIVHYKEVSLASCEITHSPTLMRIHTSPPGIPEEMYSISQEHSFLVACLQLPTNSSAPLSNMGGCPIYSCNRVPERVRCLLLVLSLLENLLTLMICGFCPQTMDMGLHRRSVSKKDK